MNKSTHKTIRVNATIENDLYMDINVPRDIEEDEIAQVIRDDLFYGTPLSNWETYSNYSGTDWRWQEHDYDMEFNPNAPDYSSEFLKQLEEPEW